MYCQKTQEKKQNKIYASGGSAATQSGTDYQNRVAAWAAVAILAEGDASLHWKLPSHTRLQYIRCETEHPVDDIMIGTSDNGFIFIQAKHSMSLQKGAKSDLASSIEQFIRQFTVYRNTRGKQPWERPLNDKTDRLVLVTGPKSSATIRENLMSMLNRLRFLTPGQPLESAAVNKKERKAFSVICNHIFSIWTRIYGEQPKDDDLQQLLSLIWVTTLDVDEEGSKEIEAKNLLKSSVLQNCNEAETAWKILIQACVMLARNRHGADLSVLQRELINVGINLKAISSYREDIERLQEYTKFTVTQLADLSTIRVSNSKIKIVRKSTEVLEDVAKKESILVVGEPGSGKSGALHDVVTNFLSEQFDVVFIAVDRIEAQSLGTLRTEMGLSHEILEVLKNWIGLKPAFFVIDALDAARSEKAIRTLHSLITDLIKNNTRWRVIASIRKFDLRYNMQLQQLFSGIPPSEYFDPEFSGSVHINIPNLNDEELAQIESQSDILAKLVFNSSLELAQLLHNLFYLKLMGELISLQTPFEELSSISRQDELLDRYWSERVIGVDGQGDAREDILRKIASFMVKNRSLKMNRAEIAGSSKNGILNELLSSQVIAEWQVSPAALPERYVLIFAHHVLHDYAVSRLLLRGTSNHFVKFLAKEPELVLAIRPSIIFYFKHLWLTDSTRQLYWDIVAEVARNDEIPEVGKLVGPSVASELAVAIEDFEPFFRMIQDKDIAIQQIAEKLCKHMVGSLLSLPENFSYRLVGTEAGPWAKFIERLSRTMTDTTAYLVRLLLAALCEQVSLSTEQQQNLIAKTARRLLTFAWESPQHDPWLISSAIQAVCRTFASDSCANAQLIRQFLKEENLKKAGAEQIRILTGEIEKLLPLDAQLVEDIYKAVFSRSEESEEKTQVGSSRILGLTSTKRQDYEMVQYNLVKAFPKFLETAPKNAVEALVLALDSYVKKHHLITEGFEEESFEFEGVITRIRRDYCIVWDDGHIYNAHEPLIMLNSLENYLIKSSNSKESVAIRKEIIGVIAKENHLAVIWRRLLRCGIKAPSTIGLEIKSLAWTRPLLTCCDTKTDAGNFIKAIFKLLDKKERERVEKTILVLSENSISDENSDQRERDRNRLIGCLPEGYIVTDKVRQIYKELKETQAFPSNEPSFRLAGWSRQPYGEKEYLAGKEVQADEEQNKNLRMIEEPIKEFNTEYLNARPTVEAIQRLLPLLHTLHERLLHADKNNVHPQQRDFAWGTLAEAGERIASVEDFDWESENGNFIKTVLLQAAEHPNPVYRPKNDRHFDEHPSWGNPAPRINAARGLMLLAYYPCCFDDKVLTAIKMLTVDKVPAVRFQIVSHLTTLYETKPDMMWAIIENTCAAEQSLGVLQGLLIGTFYKIAGANADRISLLTKKIFDRITEGAGVKPVRKASVNIFSELYLRQDNPICKEMIYKMIDAPKDFLQEVRHLVVDTKEFLTFGLDNPDNKGYKSVRTRAFIVAERVLSSVWNEIRIEDSKLKAGIELSVEEMEILKDLIGITNTIASTLYFASGALHEKQGEEKPDGKVLTIQEKKQFLFEAENLLNQLSNVGLFPKITHYLLQILQAFISLDPVIIFQKIGRIIKTAQQGGYQYESLAVDLIVKMIERYLAEYRWVFRENENCQRMLLEILDIFVNVGWPSARRLTYRLEEIYR